MRSKCDFSVLRFYPNTAGEQNVASGNIRELTYRRCTSRVNNVANCVARKPSTAVSSANNASVPSTGSKSTNASNSSVRTRNPSRR